MARARPRGRDAGREPAQERDVDPGREPGVRPPQEGRPAVEVPGVEARVGQPAEEAVGGLRLGEDLRAPRPGPADVDVAPGEIEIDQVPEVVSEIRQPGRQGASEEHLLYAGVPSEAFLGLEAGVADRPPERPGRVDLVERGRLEARSERRLDPGLRRFDEVRRRDPVGQGRPGAAVAVEARADRGEEAPVDPELVLEIDSGLVGRPAGEGAVVLSVGAPGRVAGIALLPGEVGPEGERVRRREEDVVLPVDRGPAASVRPLLRVEGMEGVDGIVQVARRAHVGQAELLLPSAAGEQRARLAAEEKRVVALSAVRVVAARAAEAVEAGLRRHGPDDEVGLEPVGEDEPQAPGEPEVPIAVLLGVPGIGRGGGGKAPGRELREAERIVENARRPSEVETIGHRAVRPALGREGEAGPALAAPGQDADHAAERVRSVERALRAAQHFHPLDVLEPEVGEVERARGIHRIVELHAVEHDEDMLGIGPADQDGGSRPRTAVGVDGKADGIAESFEDGSGLRPVEVGPGHHGHGAGDLAGGRFEARRGDHHLVLRVDGRAGRILLIDGEMRAGSCGDECRDGESGERRFPHGGWASSCKAPAVFVRKKTPPVFLPKTGNEARPRFPDSRIALLPGLPALTP